uniref:Spaetzle domain-containing protein n=1 Tax=Glossina palpalis gambiensis TaxID=67801 RepID=A0A1B0BML9_9MUSC
MILWLNAKNVTHKDSIECLEWDHGFCIEMANYPNLDNIEEALIKEYPQLIMDTDDHYFIDDETELRGIVYMEPLCRSSKKIIYPQMQNTDIGWLIIVNNEKLKQGLLIEVCEQLKKEAKKEENLQLEKAELTNRMAEINFRIERQDAQLREISRVVSELESRSLFRWTRDRLGDYQTFNPENPDQTSTSYRQKNSGGSRIRRALNYLETEVFKSKSAKKELSESTLEALQPLSGSMEDYDSITITMQRKAQSQ